MKKNPVILDSRIVAKTRIFTIEGMDIQFSNGNQVYYERLIGRLPGAVLIVPILDDETVILTREYAGGLNRYELGFPKGGVDKGETIEQAANRELMEEVGYSAGNIQVIKKLSTSPAYNQNMIYIVFASDLEPNRIKGDEPEALELVPWKIARLKELIKRDDFTDSRCISAIFLLLEYL